MCGCSDLKYAKKSHTHTQYVTIKELNSILSDYLTGDEVLSYLAANYYTKSEVDDLIAAIQTEAIGTIKVWPSNTIPSGWLLCDGEYYGDGNGTALEYPDLFDVIGYTFDIDWDDGFYNVPNLRGRVPVGRHTGQSEFDALAEVGGERTHTLTEAEMPEHYHGPALPNTHFVQRSGAGSFTVNGTGGSSSYTHNAATWNAGGDQPHNNLQPYMVVNFIIKAE